MNTEHTALVARLELKEMHIGDMDKAAAAIRALAGEVERVPELLADRNRLRSTIALRADTIAALEAERDTLRAEVERLNASIATLNVFVTEILNERDALRAEVERLLEHKTTALTKLADSRAEVAALKDVLHNVQHGNLCPAQPGWLEAGPCNCGLNAALAEKQP